MNNTGQRKAGLYIHIPFCLRKCNYCDFFSLPLADRDWLETYTKALVTEMEIKAELLASTQVESIYIGGGTPSLLSGEQLSRILKTARKCFSVKKSAEITLEANPSTLESIQVQQYIQAGINRLSLGAQSFFDDDLKMLGRIHSSSQIFKAVEILHQQGLTNFNLDLIYGIPGQDIAKWDKNIMQAVDCNPQHISTYLLQLDPATPLAVAIQKGRVNMLDEDTEVLMFEMVVDQLKRHGFDHYEISNFCRGGNVCQHNMIYWQAGEYLGIGAGAVSFMEAKRFVNRPRLQEYVKHLQAGQIPAVEQLEEMTPAQLVVDAVILGLRLCKGIDINQFNHRFGIDVTYKFQQAIDFGIKQGLLNLNQGQLSLTKKGYMLSNQALCQFIA